MSELGLGLEDDDGRHASAPGRRRSNHRKRRGLGVPGCLAVLVALAIIVGGGYFALNKGIDSLKDRLAGPEDYPGPGTGQVLVEVLKGDNGADIGNTLKAKGVVKSVDAFTNAFAANPDSTSIQVGFYELRKQMKASEAVDLMVDPANLIENTVTVPEGLRVVDIVAILADKTDFTKKQFNKVLASPAELGLPDYANGNAEGYLFPATYAFPPSATPASMLQAMVERWQQAADDADLTGAAEQLGYTPAQLMTVASLVEAEARGDDMAKVARVIYNRLEGDETNGLLQIDATINFAMDRKLGVGLSLDDLEYDSPYNTYLNAGLPPGPIEAPGDAAIKAATEPAAGNWFYYVTVNLKTGETKFTDDYDTFLGYKDEFKQYCTTSDAC